MTQPNPAPRGHNNPPTPAELLASQLELATAPERKKIDELVKTEVPDLIEDEIQAAKFADLLKEVQTTYTAYDKKREIEKAPHLAASRQVDDFFRAGKNTLEILKAKINKPLTAFAKRKADEQRAAAAEEAARLRAKSDEEVRQAQELAKVDLKEHADVQLHQAMKTEAQAIKLENATTAELSTVRGTQAVSGLRTRWVAEIQDKQKLDLEKLRPYLRLEHLQTALNGFMAAGGREITGAVIEERSTISVR